MEAETQSSILNAVCFWGLQLRSNQFFPGTIALRVTRVPSSGKERVLHAGYKPCARHLANLLQVAFMLLVPVLCFLLFIILMVFQENRPHPIHKKIPGGNKYTQFQADWATFSFTSLPISIYLAYSSSSTLKSLPTTDS